MMARDPGRVVLAAGGTGGHMFPAQALAGELLSRRIGVVLFTDRRGGGFDPESPPVETHVISAGGLAGGGLFKKAGSALRLGLGAVQARRLLKIVGADVVVGFGGYASAPTVSAGARLGMRVVLHEQNAVLGRANRLLARRARAIATSFDSVEGIADADRPKVRWTGNPVRPAIAALGRRPFELPGEREALRLLVIGGSQGASVFDRMVPAAVARLAGALRRRIRIGQQVRGPERESIAALYRSCGVGCDLRAYFDDMPEMLAAAHLVICRAGASTVAELAAAGRPGILVPYPSATDDHQTANARRLVELGGGWLLPEATLTDARLAERLESLLSNPTLLARASRSVRDSARAEDAAQRLADVVCAINDNHGDARLRQGEAA